MRMDLYFSTIWIASDHRGVTLKHNLVRHMMHQEISIPIHDLGPHTSESVPYPEYTHRLAERLSPGDMGILICGTGLGMSMAINRYPHARGALCAGPEWAVQSRRHNNANVLVLGADFIDAGQAQACFHAFLTTGFEGGRHQDRIDAFNVLAAPFWYPKV